MSLNFILHIFYKFFLYQIALFKVSKVKRGNIIFVDFDFTLALHAFPNNEMDTWNLSNSALNYFVLDLLGDDTWFLFSARGYKSSKMVKSWLRSHNLTPHSCFFLGSTNNKIKFIKKQSSKFEQIIWIDDLCDVDPISKLKKVYTVDDLPNNVNFIRIPCTYIDKS